jgi:hypothetical protein
MDTLKFSIMGKRNFITNNAYLLLLVAFAAFLRFEYPLPVLLIDDSVKFISPLNVIQSHDLDWVISSINFSLLDKIINYFIQSFDNGGLTKVIFVQKLLGILSTIVVYFTALAISRGNRIAAFITALIFTVDPLMLYIEQIIFPEPLFIFLAVSSVYLINKVLSSEGKFKTQIIYMMLTGLSLGLLNLTKQSVSVHLKATIIVLLLLGLYKILVSQGFRRYQWLILACILWLSTSVTSLPICLYNQVKHGFWGLTKFTTKGGVLWSLTEEMLVKNPPAQYQWLTDSLLRLTKEYKEIYNIPLDQYDKDAFYGAVTQLNTFGREGRLNNPDTGQIMSSLEWGDLCMDYWRITVINNPRLTLKRIYKISLPSILFSHNFDLNYQRKSSRKNSAYEVMQFTQIPFSFTDPIDPRLKTAPLISTQYMTEDTIDSGSKNTAEDGWIVIMLNRYSDAATLIREKGLSLYIQRVFVKFPFTYFIFPAFVICALILILSAKLRNDLLALYLFASSLAFLLLPTLVMAGEPRYRLQFTPFMLLFCLYVLTNFKQSEHK